MHPQIGELKEKFSRLEFSSEAPQQPPEVDFQHILQHPRRRPFEFQELPN